MLTGAESRASEAREEAGKHAKDNEEVRGKLERTASEVTCVGLRCFRHFVGGMARNILC